MQPLATIALCSLVVGSGQAFAQTSFPIPQDALHVAHRVLAEGKAYQTDFTLKTAYPSSSAFEFYAKAFGKPWYYCQWGNGWSSFIDATKDQSRRIDQQLHMWVDPKTKRSVALALRYYSNKSAKGGPDNEDQQVVLIEHIGTDLKLEIDALKLKCPREVNAAL